MSEYPDIWVTGLPLPYGPPLPTGEVNLRTGERRLYNPIRPSLPICGHARPDELAELRAKHGSAA